MPPQVGWLAPTPRPRKDSAASEDEYSPRLSEGLDHRVESSLAEPLDAEP
jgi:hypothetical protein